MRAAVLALCAASFSPAFASVYVDGTASYTDASGAQAVFGAVKNDGDHWALPRVHVSAGAESATAHLPPVGPGSEMPFKVRLSSAGPASVELEYEEADAPPWRAARVMYDGALQVHPDGRQTGMLVNTGGEELRGLRVYAVAHAQDGSMLDVGEARVAEAPPGEPVPFEMVPDPSVAGEAASYSCFAIGEPMVVEYDMERNGEPFSFRYDSAVWLAYAQFDEGGGSMSMVAKNSFPFEALANIELPVGSESEDFEVSLDGQGMEVQQSRGQMGNWHLVFRVAPFADGQLEITGFGGRPAAQPDPQWWYLLAVPAAAAAGGLALHRRRSPSRARAP